jgi:putative glutamine amidotransferase
MTATARPVIGICAVRECARWAFWNQDAHLVADSNVAPVQRAGGVAVLLPVDARAPLEMLDRIDGLMLIGGADIDPACYRAPRDPATESTYPERDEFEILMSVHAIERGLPLLGICRGMQTLNVALGGTLAQNLVAPDGSNPHRKVVGTFDGSEHTVDLEPGSLAAAAVGAQVHIARCHHHQAGPRSRRRPRGHRPSGVGRRDRGGRAHRRALGARRAVASGGRRPQSPVRRAARRGPRLRRGPVGRARETAGSS